MNITTIRAYDIKDLLHSAINEYHLTRKTLGNVKSLFSGMFAFALEKNDIKENPMDKVGKIENSNIRPEPTKKPRTQVFDKEDLPILHESMSLKTEFLFVDENENHIIRQRINDCLKYYCDKVSINAKSSHKIRKTFISNLFRNGFDIEEVMQIAGQWN